MATDRSTDLESKTGFSNADFASVNESMASSDRTTDLEADVSWSGGGDDKLLESNDGGKVLESKATCNDDTLPTSNDND